MVGLKMKNTKVLVISTVGLIYDGITNVILSNIETMDRAGLDIFIVGTIKVEPSIRERLEDCGCTVVVLPDRKKETFSYWRELIKLIKREKIEVIHANGNSATLAIEMTAGLLGGCKKRIAHSHNTRCDQVKADKLLRPLFNATYTDGLACGDDAGKWLFKDKPFTVINNGRDVEKYTFDEKKRQEFRIKQHISDYSTVIAHVGGFVPQKNHEFILNLFQAILKRTDNVIFYLIGDGVERAKIENMAMTMGIYEKIHFTGNVDNVADYLNACDVMVLPSLFEGLPLVMIEWQLSGLPCIVSSNVTSECKISHNVEFISLEADIEDWVDAVMNSHCDTRTRKHNSAEAILAATKKGFDIKDSAARLKKIYLGDKGR